MLFAEETEDFTALPYLGNLQVCVCVRVHVCVCVRVCVNRINPPPHHTHFLTLTLGQKPRQVRP